MRIRRIQRRLPRRNIRLLTRHPPRLLIDLPKNIQPKINRYPHIGRYKIINIKTFCLARKCPKPIENCNHGEETEGYPGKVGLEGRAEYYTFSRNALGDDGSVESDVSDRDGHPGEEDGYTGEVLEPGEDCLGTGGAGHEA